jgi:hypothetical protein
MYANVTMSCAENVTIGFFFNILFQGPAAKSYDWSSFCSIFGKRKKILLVLILVNIFEQKMAIVIQNTIPPFMHKKIIMLLLKKIVHLNVVRIDTKN